MFQGGEMIIDSGDVKVILNKYITNILRIGHVADFLICFKRLSFSTNKDNEKVFNYTFFAKI